MTYDIKRSPYHIKTVISVIILSLFIGTGIYHIFYDRSGQTYISEYSIGDITSQENVVPVVIIGSGPAGLTAALYIARAGMKAYVFAGPTPCGQLTQTTFVENWPGRERILGASLMDDIKNQAVSFGAKIVHDTITDIKSDTWPFVLTTEEGRTFKALSVIVATGATPKRLTIPGEQEYWGKGVTTCAVCDAPFFKNKEVVISGGGDSAAEMVFELAPYVQKVTVLVRKDRMRATAAMQKRIADYPNLVIEYHKEITHIFGDGQTVTAIDVYDNEKKTTERRAIHGVFLAIGHVPNSGMLKGAVPLDEHGYVHMYQRSQESLVKGIFAAGEIQDPKYRQAIVASGEGARAALDATSFLYSIGFTAEIGAALDEHMYEQFTDEKIDIQELTTVAEFHEKVLRTSGIVLLDFYGTTCPACIKMVPVLESMAHKFKDKITIYKNNIETPPRAIFKELYKNHDIKIKKIPALLVFKDGQLLDKNGMIMSRKEMSSYINSFL